MNNKNLHFLSLLCVQIIQPASTNKNFFTDPLDVSIKLPLSRLQIAEKALKDSGYDIDSVSKKFPFIAPGMFPSVVLHGRHFGDECDKCISSIERGKKQYYRDPVLLRSVLSTNLQFFSDPDVQTAYRIMCKDIDGSRYNNIIQEFKELSSRFEKSLEQQLDEGDFRLRAFGIDLPRSDIHLLMYGMRMELAFAQNLVRSGFRYDKNYVKRLIFNANNFIVNCSGRSFKQDAAPYGLFSILDSSDDNLRTLSHMKSILEDEVRSNEKNISNLSGQARKKFGAFSLEDDDTFITQEDFLGESSDQVGILDSGIDNNPQLGVLKDSAARKLFGAYPSLHDDALIQTTICAYKKSNKKSNGQYGLREEFRLQ